MREWVAIQQLFSLRRTCLNYPNEAEWLWLRRKALGGRGPCKAIQERPGDQGPQCVCVYVCVTRMHCEVKWSVPGSQWAAVSRRTDTQWPPSQCAHHFLILAVSEWYLTPVWPEPWLLLNQYISSIKTRHGECTCHNVEAYHYFYPALYRFWN